MRHLIAAFIAAIALTLPVAAEPIPNCARLAQWGERALPNAFAISGHFVLQADGRGLAVYDIENPAAIRRVAFAPTASPSLNLALGPGHAAVLTRDGLELFAFSADGAIAHRGSAAVTARDVAWSGETIVTVGGEAVTWNIEASRLVRGATRLLDDPADTVATSGSRVFVGSAQHGIDAFTLSGETLSHDARVSAGALDLLVDGATLYAAAGDNGLTAIDIHDRAPRVIGRVAAPDLTLHALAKSGSRLFAANGAMRVEVFDVTNAAAMTRVTSLEWPTEAIAANDDVVVVGGDAVNVTGKRLGAGTALRLHDPDGFAPLGELPDRAGRLSGVATDGRYAYVADPPLFRVIDLADPRQPLEVARYSYGDGSDRVRLDSGRVVIWGVGNAHLFDVRDPRRPLYSGAYHSKGIPPEGAAFAGPFLIEANKASGFHVLDISIPGRFHHTGGLINDFNGMFRGVAAIPGTAYAWLENGVKVVEIADNGRVRLVRVLEAPSTIDVDVIHSASGALRLAVLDDARLRLFDLSDPLRPVETGSIVTMRGRDIEADGDAVWIIADDGRVMRIDVANPASPRIALDSSGLALPTQIAAAGGIVAVADGTALTILSDVAPSDLGSVSPRISTVAANAAAIAWDPAPGASNYEIAVSNDPSFASPRVTPSKTPGAWIAYEAEPQWVRVRATKSCAAGPWSDALAIDRSVAGDIVFADSAHLLALRPGQSEMVDVEIENRSSRERTVAAFASEGGVEAPAATTVAPNGRSVIRLVVNAGPAAGSRSVVLGLREADAELPARAILRVDVVEPRLVARAAGEGRLLLPGVGSTPGSAGTHWKSDLQLHAREAVELALRYSAFGAGATAREIAFTLGAGEILVLPDAVARLFDAENTNGVLEIVTSRPDAIDAATVTYNDVPSGRYGERIVAVAPAQRPEAIRASLIAGIRHDATARTNLALIESAGLPATVRLELRDAAGSVVAAATRSLAPWEGVQLAAGALFPELPPLADGSIRIEAPAGVVAYASRVDRESGDATITFAGAFSDASLTWSPQPRFRASFDAAGSVRGAGGSDWQTSIALANPAATAAVVLLTFFPAADPARAVTHLVDVAPQGCASFDDLAGEAFPGVAPELLNTGVLVAESASPFATWGWLYNTTSAGRFGQSLPGRDISPSRVLAPESDDVTPLPRALTLFPLFEGASVRTNLGIIETAGRPATARIAFYDAGGALAGRVERALPPYGSVLIQSVLTVAGLRGGGAMSALLETGADDGVAIFASSIDARSGDALFIAGKR
jgi:hypothetical protein